MKFAAKGAWHLCNAYATSRQSSQPSTRAFPSQKRTTGRIGKVAGPIVRRHHAIAMPSLKANGNDDHVNGE